ncbi:unnamed protein product [Rhizophagus irregularis]|nr:unnamed protein product [Rhizophagus irregularis]CAB4431905.1 unnamed protein product [Rhizophagus irregularis]
MNSAMRSVLSIIVEPQFINSLNLSKPIGILSPAKIVAVPSMIVDILLLRRKVKVNRTQDMELIFYYYEVGVERHETRNFSRYFITMKV